VIRRRSHRTVRRASIGFLLALLLVPLALAAHTHPDTVAPGSCATCIVAHHTPTLATSLPTVVARAVPCIAVASQPTAAPAWTERVAPSGRGPPVPTLS
jgi:hypothetical protein